MATRRTKRKSKIKMAKKNVSFPLSFGFCKTIRKKKTVTQRFVLKKNSNSKHYIEYRHNRETI